MTAATASGSGEVSMADDGILFLDELPEFSQIVLEVLREPLEYGSVTQPFTSLSRHRTSSGSPPSLTAAADPRGGGPQ